MGITGVFILLLVFYDRRMKKKAQNTVSQPDDTETESLIEEPEEAPGEAEPEETESDISTDAGQQDAPPEDEA